MRRFLVLATIFTVSAYAGALVVEVSNPEANAEAKSLHAAVVADVSACHEPAKSVVSAFLIRDNNGSMQRVPLQVTPLKKAGTFAIIGDVPPASVIDLTVANPVYGTYQPHVLIRSDEHGMQWTSVKRFFKTPPTDADVRALL
jgi:hypothetical protein